MLPLNVSRSALQNDGFVKKVRDYITKKVADKLNGMFKTDRENYEKYWDDIHPFIKFGCLKDEKFYEKMSGSLLFKNLEGKYLPLSEINEREDKDIAYVTDEVQQSQYIKMYKDAGMDAIYLTHNIDSPFITMLEQKNAGLKFHRIDAEIKQQLKGEQDAEALKDTTEKLQQLFREQLGNEHLQVEVQDLKDEKISAMITLSEQSRRMQEMMKMYGMGDMGSTENTLVLNANNALVKYVLENPESEHVSTICHQLYDLALIAHEPLPADEMAAFVERSNEIMMLLTK